MADMRENLDLSWTEHDRTIDRFAAFSALDDDAKASWLAWCVAKTLEASMGVPKKPGQSGPEPIDMHDYLGALMDISVAGHWRPTSANYFDRVSKQTLLAHVTEVGGPTMAASFMGSKKGDLSAFVEEAVRWRVFDQMLGQAREGLDGLAAADAENLLDEALSQVREEGLANARYEAFQSATPPLVAMEAAPPYRAGKPKATAKKSATKKPAAKKSV